MSQAIKTAAFEGELAGRGDLAHTRFFQPFLDHADVPSRASDEKIFVVDDDYFAREYICSLLSDAGWSVEAFSSCEAFLVAHRSAPNTCLVLDMHFPGMGGLELMAHLGELSDGLPVVAVSGSSAIAEAVQSMKQGALDFIEKPVVADLLVASVMRALARSRRADKVSASREALVDRLRGLTARQNQILDRVLAGQPSKNIAADLGISQRTVENHRASIMQRTGARSMPALARMVMCKHCSAN